MTIFDKLGLFDKSMGCNFMAVKVCEGPKLYEVKYRENVSGEFSFNAIFRHMRENKVCENLDREIQELKRQEARSWARARERGARF